MYPSCIYITFLVDIDRKTMVSGQTVIKFKQNEDKSEKSHNTKKVIRHMLYKRDKKTVQCITKTPQQSLKERIL